MKLLIDFGKWIISNLTRYSIGRNESVRSPDFDIINEEDSFEFIFNGVWGVAKGINSGMIKFEPEDWAPGIWAGTDGMVLQLTKLNSPHRNPEIELVVINFVDLNHRTIYLHSHLTLDGWWEIRPYREPLVV